MPDAGTILDAIAPPAGYSFHSGVWTTHDLSISALNQLLLPALAGFGTTDQRAGVAAPGFLPDDALVIAAAADRITADGLVPGGKVTVAAVGSRRLHAKVGVLLYTNDAPGKGGASTAILTLVTSANLTKAGLTSNREVFFAEWLPSNAGGPSIAQPAIDAITLLALDLPESAPKLQLRKTLVAISGGLSRKSTKDEGVIAHSLNAQPAVTLPESLLKPRLDTGEVVMRVTLIGPAFADNNSPVATSLSWLFAKGVSVDIVVDTWCSTTDLATGHASVQVPKRLRDDLEAMVGKKHVTVFAAATDDPATRSNRTLHGKAIIVETDRAVWHLIGSANMTQRGLGGANRELIVLRAGNPGDTDRVLARLNAVKASRVIDRTQGDAELPPKVAEGTAPVIASFTPDDDQDASSGLVRGILTVTGVPEDGTIHFLDGSTETLEGGQCRVALDQHHLGLWINVGKKRRKILVTVNPLDPEYWTECPEDTVTDPVDPLLRMLRRDYASAAIEGGKDQGGGTLTNDQFQVPANVRLNVLARYSGALRSMPAKHIDTLLELYFPDDDPERSIAQAIADGSAGTKNPSDDHLTGLLRTAIAKHAEGI